MADQINKKAKDTGTFKEAVETQVAPPVEIHVPPPPPVKLNLGCGWRKEAGYINIDSREIVNPDRCGDVFEILKTYADSSVDEIRAFDFMEHVFPKDVVLLMWQIHRVLKSDGVFHFFIPSTDARGAFMDPTHVSFWNINTWLYYTDPDWYALYPELPRFKLLLLGDGLTSKHLHIIHTEGKVVPIK